jgi:hypothetical protein
MLQSFWSLDIAVNNAALGQPIPAVGVKEQNLLLMSQGQ